MRKHFLILMLLALLPFTAWALSGVNVTVGDYTVNINQQVMFEATAPEVISIKQGSTPLDPEDYAVTSYRYQTIGHKVDAISAAGLYYLEIIYDGTKALYVPFYVADELTTIRVKDEGTFNQEMAAGHAYDLYYKEWTWCDVWYQYAKNNGVRLLPGDQPTATGANTAGQFEVHTNVSSEVTAAENWYAGLMNGEFANKIGRSWEATHITNPDNIVFTVSQAGTFRVLVDYDGAISYPWGDRIFGSNDKKYGLIRTDEITTGTFDYSKLKMYLEPTTFPDAVEATVQSNVDVTLDPNVINVMYPDNVGGVVPAVKASDFSISAGPYPTGIITAAEAKASLIASEILKIQTVGGAAIPAITGSVKYYFDIDQEKLDASVWAGAQIHVAKNGDLNVIARPLSDETVKITANPQEAGYKAGDPATYEYVFDATEHQPKPFVTIGAYDPAVTTNRLEENTHFTYEWSFNKNVNGVAETPGNAQTAGTPTVTIKAKEGSGYTGSATFAFDITQRAFSDKVTISAIEPQTYNHGEEIKPEFTVTDAGLNNYEMIAGRDYHKTNVAWDKNINATGTAEADKASVTISPDGNYKAGTTTATATAVGKFIILPKSINENDIEFANVVDSVYHYGDSIKMNHNDPTATPGVVELKWKYNDGTADMYYHIPAIFDYTYANNVNVGIATITAKIKENLTDGALIAAAKNYTYTGAGKTTTFQIKPRKLTDVDGLTITVKADEAVYNEGDAVTPTITVTRTGATDPIELEAGVDYAISGWDNNINVTPNPITSQSDYAKVTIIGKGNYAAVNTDATPVSASQTFVIGVKPVVLEGVGPATAKPYGTSEANFGFTYTTNLTKTAVADFLNKFGGKVTYKPYSNPTSGNPAQIDTPFNELAVGTYKLRAIWTAYDTTPLTPTEIADREAAHQPYDTEAQINARANYSFPTDIFKLGTFTIATTTLTLVPQPAEKFYGVADDPAFTYVILNSEGDTIQIADWTAGTEPVFAREAGTDAGDYVISVTTAPAYPNYVFEPSQTATFTIKKFPITITANPQTILFGSEPNTDCGYTDFVKTVDGNVEKLDPSMITVTITPTQLADQTIINRGSVNDGGLGLTLTWDKNVVPNDGVYVGALVPAIASQNFDATIVKGTLTIKNDAPAITLVRVAKAKFDSEENTAASYVKQYADKKVTVNIKFNDADDYNTLKANKWYAMILPFKTTVKEISDAFGYAIVDLLDTENDNAHRTLFKLHMSTDSIPANTPFLIKVWDTINMHEDGVTFTRTNGGLPIVAPEAYDEIAVSDKAGNQFIGSYTGINGFAAFKPEYSGHVTWWSLNQGAAYDNNAVKAGDNAYLRQLSAFNYIPGDLAAHEIVIEELGGGTTVIRNLNADAQTFSGEGWYNLNGVKLQSVPAEKGVYIHNGKKIVIK